MEDIVSFSRIKTLGSLYYKQAETSYLAFLKADLEISESPKDEWDADYHSQLDSHLLAGIQTIVFSAMCVEAAAFDYAAVHLGDEFVLQHLDKLDIISKWLVALRLISDYNLPKDGALYGSLKRLVRARNLLVHVKSENFDSRNPIEQQRRIELESEKLSKDVHEAFRCLPLMSLTFQKAAPAASYHLPWPFMPHSMGGTEMAPEVHAVLAGCRKIVAAQVEG